ncbi:MAG: thioredoxin family protein [Planctomycetota bacterium]
MPPTIAALFVIALSPSLDAPFREITFEQALAAAKTESKVVMVDFYTDWCQPCKLMDLNTWKAKSVHDWLAQHAVPIKVDADEEKELAARYNVKGYPSMLFIAPDGVELDRSIGFRAADDFIADGNQIIAGNGALQRVRQKLKGRESDPVIRQELARALASRARYDEALTEYLWCLDNGAAVPSFAATRRRQLVPEIASFSLTYAPARVALEERRAKIEAAMEGGGDPATARELATLNQNLQLSGRTLDTYRDLESRGKLEPDVRDEILDDVVDLCLESNDSAEAVRLIGDVDAWARHQYSPLKALEAQVDAGAGQAIAGGAAELSAARQTRARRAVRAYEAFLAVKQPEKANAIADHMLAAIPAGSSYAILIESAIAANDSEAARAFVKKAEATLNATEMRRVKIAAKKIAPTSE